VRFYLLSLFFRTRTAKNSGGAAGVLLLFRLRELSQPRRIGRHYDRTMARPALQHTIEIESAIGCALPQ
jgi:hypothetical protein